eukprot:1756052-Prymnesium_polylepis.1
MSVRREARYQRKRDDSKVLLKRSNDDILHSPRPVEGCDVDNELRATEEERQPRRSCSGGQAERLEHGSRRATTR